MPLPDYELAPAIWGGSVGLASGYCFYTPSAFWSDWVLILTVFVCPRSASASPYRVHLRSMSTNKPHPLASTPILEYPCHKEWWEYQLVVSIFGDHLGLLFCSGRPGICGYDRLAIWNWRTGALLEVRPCLIM